MAKISMHLSIDRDVFDLAHNMNINISNEFEKWIRIRANQKEVVNTQERIDIEIAKHKEAISMLETKNAEKIRLEMQMKEESDLLNKIIDNIKTNYPTVNSAIVTERASGLQSIWFRNFNKRITMSQACDMLTEALISKGVTING